MQNNYLRNEIARVYNKYTLCGELRALEYANLVIKTKIVYINDKIDALIAMICINHGFEIAPYFLYSERDRFRKIISLLTYKHYFTIKAYRRKLFLGKYDWR